MRTGARVMLAVSYLSVGACGEPRPESDRVRTVEARGEQDAGPTADLTTECAAVAAAIDKAPGFTEETVADAAATRAIYREDARLLRATSPRDRRLAEAVTSAAAIFDSLAEHAEQSAADSAELTKATKDFLDQWPPTMITLSELMSSCVDSRNTPKDCKAVLAITKKLYPAEKASALEALEQMQSMVAQLEAMKATSSSVKIRIAKLKADVATLAARREAMKRADETVRRDSKTDELRAAWARLHASCPNITTR